MQPKAVTTGTLTRWRQGRVLMGAAVTVSVMGVSSEQFEPVAHLEQPRRADGNRDSSTTPWNSGCHNGSTLKTNSRSPMARNASAPKIAPTALPRPPNSDTPPSTTAAMEYSV